MGNIGFPELLVILVVAFLFLGPKRLPDVARALGEAVRAFREALHGAAQDPRPSDAPPTVHDGAPTANLPTIPDRPPAPQPPHDA